MGSTLKRKIFIFIPRLILCLEKKMQEKKGHIDLNAQVTMKKMPPISYCKVFCKVGDRKTGYYAEKQSTENMKFGCMSYKAKKLRNMGWDLFFLAFPLVQYRCLQQSQMSRSFLLKGHFQAMIHLIALQKSKTSKVNRVM